MTGIKNVNRGEIRSQIDSICNHSWSGGVSNLLPVIEQVTYLLFIKRLDELHTAPSTCRSGQRDLGGRKMSQGLTLPNAADFCPNVESLAPGSSELGGSDMIATKIKPVVDLIVG